MAVLVFLISEQQTQEYKYSRMEQIVQQFMNLDVHHLPMQLTSQHTLFFPQAFLSGGLLFI